MTKDSAGVEGTQENANSEGSGNEAGQRSSGQSEYVTVEQFREIQNQLRLIQRTTQGDKDRAVRATNERVDKIETDLKQVLQRAAKEGKSASEVVQEMNEQERSYNEQLITDMARAFKEGKFPQPASQGSGSDGEVDMMNVIEDFGLDIEDRRVAAFATQSFETIEAAERAAVALLKKINKTSAPSESERPVREGDAGRPTPKLEQLRAQYDEEIKNARGVKAVTNVKMKYRKMGLPIS